MIRLGKMSDLDQILNLVEEAKELMKEHDNEQWDDQYPLLEHFEEDIAKDYLYVLEENDKIYGFIVVDQDQAEWYDDIDWPVNREGAFVIHRLTGSKGYKGAATELFNYVIDVVKARGAEVILTDTFALNKPAQGLFA
ncbi:GNAT family N-acetyltransferase, partial [Staphylococcus aureus]|nr:GNAT family N-acetyltransferase [Staphylococcus aureus]